jgi:hypothetical protein
MSDPYKAASKGTQRLALLAMIVLFVLSVVILGSGGPLVLPIGVFLLVAVAYLLWDWLADRRQQSAG